MKLLIAGAGGHGRVVADAALASGRYAAVAFLDDRQRGLVIPGDWPVIGGIESLAAHIGQYDAFAAAFGDAGLRQSCLERATSLGFNVSPIIHPSAVVSRFSSLGPGTTVLAGGIVNIGARLGAACIVNTGATVDHDCLLGDAVHVCPGAHLAGNVSIGSRTWFGIGAVARHGVRIGAEVMVGAGAVVVADVPDHSVVVGNPAKPMAR